MKQILKLATILIALTLLSCSTRAQVREQYAGQIDSLLKTKLPGTFNGVVFIAQKGKVLYSKAYGYNQLPDKNKFLKITDRFSTMSVAKQVTATLVLLQVEKGILDLHTPIRKYLPGLKYSWADTVTLHHLLNHTSGLQSDDMDLPLKFNPGKEFCYANVGYAVAGMVLEKQSRMTYRQLVTALFKQCGMKGSAYYTSQNQHLLSRGHTIQKDGKILPRKRISIKPQDYFGSHLMVTAPDLAQWNECLHNGKILKPATYSLMTSYTITARHPLFGSEPVGYGYGLRINDKNGLKEIGHTGYHPYEGFTAVNLYYPETHTSVVVLENQAKENFDIAYYFEQAIRSIVLNSGLAGSTTRAQQTTGSLLHSINDIIAAKKADIGVSIIGPDSTMLAINGDKLYPMLSTVKFPIALAVLNKVEKGELTMDQQLLIKKEELFQHMWSPFREKFPEGNITVTLEEALMWMVGYSDNNLTDVLLKLIGGTSPVQEFIGSKNFIIKNNYFEIHKDWASQFINQATPNKFTQLLKSFSDGKILNKEHTNWLYQTMVNSATGTRRLKGKLPDVIIAQRAGTSFTNDKGITGAVNNVGIIELPGQQKIYIAVFIHDTSETPGKAEEIIADIARVAYDFYTRR